MVDTPGKPIDETREFGTRTWRGMAIEEPRFGTPTPTSSEMAIEEVCSRFGSFCFQNPIPTPTSKTHTSNALINETSSYLQRNAHSPVKWRPWGEEAFKEARDAQAPIFLSIGYSTCKECYSMDTYFDLGEDVAEFLNAYFVCVKVDRDERPDVGKVYLEFVRFSVKDKGWPVNVFLSPDLMPLWQAFNTPSAFKYTVVTVKAAWYNDPPLPGSYPDLHDREYLIKNGNRLFREWSIQLFKNANWSQLKEDDPLLLLRGIVQKEADPLDGMLKRKGSEKDCPVKNVVKATPSTPSASSSAEPKRGLNHPEGSSNDDGLSEAGIKKTRLCKNHCTTNGCMSGGNCRFAHGKKELWKPRLPYHDPPQEYAASREESGGECFKTQTVLYIVQKEADPLGGMLKREDSEKDCPVKNVVKAMSSTPCASSRAEPKRGLNHPEGSSNDDGLSQAGIKKTRLCKNHYTIEGCVSGGNCHLAHGKKELWKPRLPYHDPPQGYAASREESGGKMLTNAVCAGSIILGKIFSKTGAKLSVTLDESDSSSICVALEGSSDQITKAMAIVGQRVRRVIPPSYREEYIAPSRLPVRAPPPVLVASEDIFGF